MLGQGVRLPWDEVPRVVRDAVAAIAGAPVVGATTCAGGFSPGAAARLDLLGGGRAFVKAVSTAQNPYTPDMYRTEAAVNGWLPPHPSVPRLLGTHDDGDWVALVFEFVDAPLPSLPWVPDELGAVLDAVRSFHRVATPAPAAAPDVATAYADDFSSWRRALDAPPDGLDEWSLANLGLLASLESSWAAAAEGDTLLHCDVRADNVLVRDGRAWLLDWPWASRGAAWVDLVLFAPTVTLQGGPPPEDVLAAVYPDAPRDRVIPVLAALTGYCAVAATRPPAPGLPTVRAHQAALARAGQEWLRRLLGV